MFWLLLLTAAAIAIVIYWRHRRGIYSAYNDIMLDIPSYPIIGQGYIFRGTDEDRMNSLLRLGRLALEQGGLSSTWLGRKLYVAIADPEAMEVAAKACLEKDESTMKYLRGVLGDGLIFAPVKIWRPRRKIMAPTFNMKNLQQFVTIFDQQSSVMVENLRARAGRGDFSLWEYITTYTFDSICETVLGKKLNAQKHLHHPFISAFDIVTQILARRMLSLWLYWDWVFRLTSLYNQFVEQRQVMYDFFDETLRDKRRQLTVGQVADNDASGRCKRSFLDMMIESSGGAKGYSDIELREEVLSIVSAGTDTSAVGTAFTALMLSRFPRVQDKVYQEIKEVFGDSDRPVAWQDLPKLKYLEIVIKETLRLYPPAPVVVRDVHETVALPNGMKLLPGMGLVLHLWATHRNTRYWGADAEQFRPERFLEGPLRHPAQFVAFSYSLRNCIGGNYAMMSTKTNLANLLRRYSVLPPASVPADQLTLPLRTKFDIMMKHCDNFEVRLEHRKKTDDTLRDKRRQLTVGQVADNDASGRCKRSFLDMMIESSGGAKGYSDIELREEVLSIVSAGTDTSAVGTAFTALMLSRFPRVQDKVYQEIKEVFGDSDRPVAWQDLPKLKYLEIVIKETLRLYPPAPVVVRDVHETVALPNGMKLLPGMGLVLHLWATHRNTRYWGADAEQFRPERFLEGPLRHPAQFVAFSYSLRNCIGGNYAMMSTKTNLANLLRRYSVLPPASVPADQLTLPLRTKFDIMMKHCDNFEVRLEHRKKTDDVH